MPRIHPLDTERAVFVCMALIWLAPYSNACSSRALPPPRPTMQPAMTTARPNITFPISNCPPAYAEWYCFNKATCFTVEIHSEILYSCECANGFIGQRCEYKEIDGSYLPTRQRAMLETASIASGATLAFFMMFFLCLTLYMKHEKKLQAKLQESSGGVGAHENGGMDEVDGMTKVASKRPFGPHHYHVLPLSAAFKR